MISEPVVQTELEQSTSNAIQLENIYAGYKNHTILKDISFTMPSGSCWAIIGPSGAGKTTLFKVITGLLNPQKGKIAILDNDLSNSSSKIWDKLKGRIGYIPQNLGLVSNLDVKTNIMLGALGRTSLLPSLFGLMTNSDHKKTKDIMERLQISQLAKHNVRTLSGGEKRRVAIARALLHQPEMLVADELLSELDAGTAKKVMTEIKNLQMEYGTSIILIEHNIDAAFEYADTVVVVNEGEILSIIESKDKSKLSQIKELMIDDRS